MPRTVAELLAEASNRDEILAAFFAFARQFFDYSALFVVQDDLAEGREAHGPGATTAEVERISLALEEPGLYAETRRLGIARVTSLDANDADRALAARLRRPEGAPCVVLPLSIRRRVVLILHGDRSGDAVTLEDLPELLGVVPRVGEAFERLILRRKVGRAGETQMPEAATPAATSIPRAAAIPRDAARALAAIASAGVSVAPGPITAEKVAALDVEAPPQPPIAATSPASPPAVQAAAQGAAASVVPARSVPGAADALAMLGVPRSAPPPPMPGRTQRPAQVEHDDVIVEVSAAPPDDDDAEDQDADDRDVTVEVSATSRDDDEDDDRDVTVEVSATSRDDDDEDDDRDVTVEVSATPLDDDDADSDDEDEHPTSPGRVTAPTAVAVPPSDPAHARRGGYSLKDVADEVVAVRPPAATKPTSDRASPRQDPRRDGSSTTRDEQIRVGNAARPASKPSLTRDTRPDSPNSHARRRSAPPATASRHREPSVIVDMGDQVEALLDELTSMSPDGPPTFFDRLLRIGDAALPALAQRFPGGLWFDRHAPHTRPPRGRDVSAIARALTIFHERAVPYLPGLLDASEQDIRYYATLVAADLPHPTLVEALGRRLFDTDAGTRVLALDVIKGFAHFPEFATLREELRTTARVLHRDLTRRRTAIRALAELRDAQAVPMLLAVLDDDDEGVRGEAHRALVTLTRQDFGLQRKRWEPWAEKHARAHRIEWLIDALLHDDESLRAAAGDELKRVTQEYYGYHPGSPRRERERVHRKYQQWWESEGRARF
jgi:hypothetical protein